MQALLLSIVFNTIIGIIFKLFSKYKIDIFQAIVFNYLTCVSIAWIDLGFFPIQSDSVQSNWFIWAIVLGFLFISGFNMVGQTVKLFGITTGAIMQKMSLGFTVIFSFLALGEIMSGMKWLGVLSAILAIVFTNFPKKQKGPKESIKLDYKIVIPILALVIATLIEIVFLIVEKHLGVRSANPVFMGTLFGTAAAIGITLTLILILTNKTSIHWKNMVAGLALGIPNYLAIYYMLKSLAIYDASVFFTLNNVGIIVLAAILSLVFFKERFSAYQYFGIGLSVLAILLIFFGQ